jgi:hypothetical protein
VKHHLSNFRNERPVHKFSTDKKHNPSFYISNEHNEVDRVMLFSPHSNQYSPNINAVKSGIARRIKVGESQPRWDEYRFKRMTEKSPSPNAYQALTQNEVGHKDPFKSNSNVSC